MTQVKIMEQKNIQQRAVKQKTFKQLDSQNIGYYLVVQCFIAYSGLFLLISGQQRNRFYTTFDKYFSSEQQSQKLAQFLLIFLSLSMMSIIVLEKSLFKLASIFSFAYYNTFCYNLIDQYSKKLLVQDCCIFILNYVIVWIGISGSYDIEDIKSVIKQRSQNLISQQDYYDEGWYPLQLPVQQNDVESTQMEIQRLSQILNLSKEQIVVLQKLIQKKSDSPQRKTLRKMREHQFEKYSKQQIKKINKIRQQILKNQKNGKQLLKQQQKYGNNAKQQTKITRSAIVKTTGQIKQQRFQVVKLQNEQKALKSKTSRKNSKINKIQKEKVHKQ